MKLYHTSNQEIREPDIHRGRKNADFGWGFYLSPDRDFVYRWAEREAVVNIYELDESELDIHTFTRSDEWFSYIYNNRRAKDCLDCDIVIGPIANDTIFDTLGITSSGYLKPDEALGLLMIGPEYTQVAIKTPKALGHLRWTGAEKIEAMDREDFLAEQEAYQKLFAEKLTSMGT